MSDECSRMISFYLFLSVLSHAYFYILNHSFVELTWISLSCTLLLSAALFTKNFRLLQFTILLSVGSFLLWVLNVIITLQAHPTSVVLHVSAFAVALVMLKTTPLTNKLWILSLPYLAASQIVTYLVYLYKPYIPLSYRGSSINLVHVTNPVLQISGRMIFYYYLIVYLIATIYFIIINMTLIYVRRRMMQTSTIPNEI